MSYAVGIGNFFFEESWPERESDQSPPSRNEIINGHGTLFTAPYVPS
jgi:hypothetical protein